MAKPNSEPALSADEQALLAAIIAHPDEDTPRLVYADWLDEHADVLPGRDPKEVRARAEFIRAQIDVLRLPSNDPIATHLRTRVEQLHSRYGVGWCGRDTQDLVRGFPIALRLYHLSEICDTAEHLLYRHPIQVVSADEAYSRDTEEEAAVCSSPHFARFTGLGSTCRGWDGDRVAKVLTNPHLTNLRVLDLFCGGYNRTDGALGIAAATHLTNLLVLELGGNKIEDEGLEALASAEHLASLRSLRLGRDNSGAANGITEEGIAALARSTCFSSLTQLALDGNEVGAGGVEQLLKAEWLPNLTELNLEHTWISESGLMALAHSGRLTNLRRLGVSANGITETVARAFLHPGSFPNLVELHFSSNHELEEPLTEATQVALGERFGPHAIGPRLTDFTAVCIEDDVCRRMH